MIHLIAQCVLNLTRAFDILPSFYPTTKGFLVEFLDRHENEAYLHHIFC
jgi:hypothetical protein